MENFQELNPKIDSSYDISFFVPCLNEQGNIGPTLLNIIAVAASYKFTYEILVFDDCSKDGSIGEIDQVAKANPKVQLRVFQGEYRRGLARNYVNGSYVGRGKYYMLVNGDNAEPPEALKAVLDHMGEADIIIPVFVRSDRRTWGRVAISKTFTFCVNLITGNSIHYYNGPALHFRGNIMRWHADTDGFGYQAEIITRLIQEGASYKEVIITNNDRAAGASSALTSKNFLAVSHSLIQIFARTVRHRMFYRNRKGKAA